MHVSLFGTVLSISDNIMYYQWLISVFLKNTSRDQLLQKAYYTGSSNPYSGQKGIWTRDLRISNPTLYPLGHAASLTNS